MRKRHFITAIIFLFLSSAAFPQSSAENIFIITTDGFRWQEMFGGMDSVIANQQKFNQGDSADIFKKYWADDVYERRKKLLPFIWNTIGVKGQLYGNRYFENKVDNANPFWFSYPGYNEILCGYADTAINTNDYPNNPNTTVLEFFNHQPKYKNKVAAFAAWEAFNRILNEPRCGFPVVAAYDATGGERPNAKEQLLNEMLEDTYRPWGESECLDVFTHYAALEYLKKERPKILYISYGETDEWAHAGKYKNYLDAANRFDKWLNDLWSFIQHTPEYKDRTALFITTDHGRGDIDKNTWTDHGSSVPDAHEIWFGVVGPGVAAKGEMKNNIQVYQNQFAQTIASLAGLHFTANQPVAEAIKEVK